MAEDPLSPVLRAAIDAATAQEARFKDLENGTKADREAFLGHLERLDGHMANMVREVQLGREETAAVRSLAVGHVHDHELLRSEDRLRAVEKVVDTLEDTGEGTVRVREGQRGVWDLVDKYLTRGMSFGSVILTAYIVFVK